MRVIFRLGAATTAPAVNDRRGHASAEGRAPPEAG